MSKLKFIDLFAGLGDIAKPKEPFFLTTHQNNVNNLYISRHSHEHFHFNKETTFNSCKRA